ncbi:class I SAM-dependent methyltransferase [Streptomyces canus]|uniref:class I SAM-dependent methyltransferase n=1 Tax=Streptomyces canus TaxID=58343 RepID=UPI002E33C2C6|nr:class I SAM-dependent methyltransferase [Streptomyces canus]
MRINTAYEGALGDYFADNATDGPYNAHTDRPAMFALAGDVTGLRVLDIGCGAGHYVTELRARGAAEVVGVEGSATLLRHARDRVGDDDAVTVHHHDLEEPLDFLPDDSFDLVVMALVHHHWRRVGNCWPNCTACCVPAGSCWSPRSIRPPTGSGTAVPTSTRTVSRRVSGTAVPRTPTAV